MCQLHFCPPCHFHLASRELRLQCHRPYASFTSHGSLGVPPLGPVTKHDPLKKPWCFAGVPPKSKTLADETELLMKRRSSKQLWGLQESSGGMWIFNIKKKMTVKETFDLSWSTFTLHMIIVYMFTSSEVMRIRNLPLWPINSSITHTPSLVEPFFQVRWISGNCMESLC